MNWIYYYNTLRQFQKTHTTQQYCLDFLQLTNYSGEIFSSEEISNLLSSMKSIDNPNFTLFPFSENSKSLFDLGNYHLIAQLLFHLPHLDLSWMNICNPASYDLESFYSNTLGNSSQSFFYLNNISIVELLKSNDDNKILTFLFILCLPCCDQDTHLWDNHGEHLCGTPFINDNNYKMLIEISLDTHKDIFHHLCLSEYNISIKIIEKFIDSQTDLLDFSNINWKDYLPIHQFYQLAKHNCFPNNLRQLLLAKHIVLFPNLLNFLDKFNYELLENIMLSEAPLNDINNKITKY